MSRTPIAPEEFAEFAEAFSRLESIATLYSATHARSREASARVLAAMSLISDASGKLSLELANERFIVGSHPVQLSTRALVSLHAELDCLGILRLEIDARADGEHVHQIASGLRSAGMRFLTTHSLQVIDLGTLPSTIRVQFREFGRRVAAPASAQLVGGSVDSMVEAACSPLMSADIDEKTRDACLGWVKKSMRRIVERVETNTPSGGQSSPESPHRSLDDVLQLAGRTMEHALTEFLTNSANQSGLQRMFHSIEMATAMCDDPESARLMVEVLHESAEEVLRDSQTLQELEEPMAAGEKFQLSLEELQRQLTLLKPAIEQMANLERDDRSEALSILLGALGPETSDVDLARIAAKLPTLATEPHTRGEKQTLTAAIGALCSTGNERAIDQSLPMIIAALGNDNVELWLGAASEVAAGFTPEELAPLWPHLANEVLHGPRAKSEAMHSKALLQVARLPQACLDAGMKRLITLPAFTRGSFSHFAFASERDDLAPFYLALLKTRYAEIVGDLLLANLRSRSPQWKGGVVFHTFARCDTACRDLLCDLLRNGTLNQAQASTQLEAGRLIAQRIVTLPLERAAESWVPRALEALGSVPTIEAERALHRILDERKHLIVPLWPSSCRDAARRALSEHGRASAVRRN